MYAMKTSLTTLVAAAALAAPAAAMTVVYENDFETGTAGPEWSKTDTGTSPSGENFLGNFGRNIVELTLTDLPAHNEVTVTFDLYLIKSWDGVGEFGNDSWWLAVDGEKQFESTFSNANDLPGEGQHYPNPANDTDIHAPRSGAFANNSLGFTFAGVPTDSTYRMSFTIPHTGDDLVIRFRGGRELENLGNESWALDNVEVGVAAIGEPIPAPAGVAALALGLAGATCRRR